MAVSRRKFLQPCLAGGASLLAAAPKSWALEPINVANPLGFYPNHDCLKSSDQREGQDHCYGYGSWDGRASQTHEIAFAGTLLYSGEDDYTGNVCLDPQRLDTVFSRRMPSRRLASRS